LSLLLRMNYPWITFYFLSISHLWCVSMQYLLVDFFLCIRRTSWNRLVMVLSLTVSWHFQHMHWQCAELAIIIWIVRHIRHVLSLKVKTLACGMAVARLDYCNSILHGAPMCTVLKLQCMLNSLNHVYVLFVGCKSNRIHYKLATLPTCHKWHELHKRRIT